MSILRGWILILFFNTWLGFPKLTACQNCSFTITLCSSFIPQFFSGKLVENVFIFLLLIWQITINIRTKSWWSVLTGSQLCKTTFMCYLSSISIQKRTLKIITVNSRIITICFPSRLLSQIRITVCCPENCIISPKKFTKKTILNIESSLNWDMLYFKEHLQSIAV